MSHKICFYIRVSTEEQAKNLEGSIRNQKERLFEAVKFKNLSDNFGEVVSVFIDRAKSGKDTKRPELQKMLFEISQGNIDLVMVSEISRISRNMKDFAEIWELMKKYSCGFYSLRENFDTTTAAGEMVLYTIANIAQFERRQVSERVSANIKARSKRGLYNGGSVPVGYKLNANKKGHLEIDEEMEPLVKLAYDTFLERDSLSQTAKFLNDSDYRLKRWKQGGGKFQRSSQFTVDNLHKMLTNKIYIGVKTYQEDGKEKEAKAVWEPIINRNIFDRVQEKMKKNYRRKKPHSKSRYPYLLSGITYCAKCGDVMCGKSAHGNTGKVGYYEHSWATKKDSTLSKKTFKCSPHRVGAKVLEPIVVDEVEKLLFGETLSKRLFSKVEEQNKLNCKNSEADKIKAKIYGLNSQIDALAERLSTLPVEISAEPIYRQMKLLESNRVAAEEQLQEVLASGTDINYRADLREYNAFLSGMRKGWLVGGSEVKSRIIQRLIHRVEISDEKVAIHYNIDKRSIATNNKINGFSGEKVLEKNFSNFIGSNSLTNGAQERT